MAQRKSILIVEDDTDMARLNSRLLKRQGYDVFVACNAVEARAIVLEISPDIFVMDIGLPDGNGLELCREFRKISDAPLIFLTGKSATQDKITGLDSGGDYYLTKPYDKDELISIVQALLRRAEQTQKKIAEATFIERGSLTLKLDERKAFVNQKDTKLSTKEFSLLLLLVQNEDKELSHEFLYEAIFGTVMNNDSSSLRQMMSRMRRKINEEEAIDFYILNEHGFGYTFTAFR